MYNSKKNLSTGLLASESVILGFLMVWSQCCPLPLLKTEIKSLITDIQLCHTQVHGTHASQTDKQSKQIGKIVRQWDCNDFKGGPGPEHNMSSQMWITNINPNSEHLRETQFNVIFGIFQFNKSIIINI